MAGAFLFSGDDIFKKVEFLSGGEKNRLALLRMLLQPFNLLIMDEPTNHLDIHSKDILLEALKKYEGTLIFVSHDRYFIEQLAEKVLELSSEGATLYQGDYQYYLWKKENDLTQGQIEENEQSDSSIKSENQENSLSREEEKKLKAQIRRLERQEEYFLEQLGKLSDEQQLLEEKLALPEVYSNIEKSLEISKRIEEIKEQEINISYQWEEISQELQEARQIKHSP
jgi:ATP-binding cassette subfamily F protein 3